MFGMAGNIPLLMGRGPIHASIRLQGNLWTGIKLSDPEADSLHLSKEVVYPFM